jgi:hypothetical protein
LPESHEALTRRIRHQADACLRLGSPFYAALLEAVAADVEAEGPAWNVLADFEQERGRSALALRLMGAVHRLVLLGTLSELATHYPSTGGDGDPAAAWPLFRDALMEHREEVTALLRRGCQTNEVGRSAALLGGYLEVAHRTHMPLRILELGASAGLNLRWDRYRYEALDGAWGDADSPVRFDHAFDVPPPLNRTAEVVKRNGCDVAPIDPTSEEGSLTLRSFVWADQLSRLAVLDGAIALAAEMPIEVERSDAASFLERELAIPHVGVATVVYHSVFMQYVGDEERARIDRSIARAYEQSTPRAPFFHLSMEPREATFEIRLGDELLGESRAHGTGVVWLVP